MNTISHNPILNTLSQLFSLFFCCYQFESHNNSRQKCIHTNSVFILQVKVYEFSSVSATLQDEYTRNEHTYALQSNNFSYNFSYFHHEEKSYFYCAIFDMCLSVWILLMVCACMHIHSDIEYCQEHSKTVFFQIFFFTKNIYR